MRKNKKKPGDSIKARPSQAETSEEFGHWEIDAVIAKSTEKVQ